MNDILIELDFNKDPYIKEITNDKVINITGETGSGKSYYSKDWINDNKYIVIDTDVIFSNNQSNNKESIELRELFKDKPKDYLFSNFDEFYLKILNYFKDADKTIVIDSAQYRNMKNVSLLKGKIIIMRTSINNCYKRCINRFRKANPNYTEEELEKYSNKKKEMYEWYKSLNEFIKKVDKL